MDLRYITRESVRILQKYVYTGTILVGEDLVPQYEWQDVPDAEE